MPEVTQAAPDRRLPPSSIPGVFLTSWGTRYYAQIRVGKGRRLYLGTFDDEADAAAAVDQAKRRLRLD